MPRIVHPFSRLPIVSIEWLPAHPIPNHGRTLKGERKYVIRSLCCAIPVAYKQRRIKKGQADFNSCSIYPAKDSSKREKGESSMMQVQ
jgi:hypothetical protein